MSNHDFDTYILNQYVAGLNKPNEEEVVQALMSIESKRTREIIIKRIYEKQTFTALGKEYGFSRQYAHYLFNAGIQEIKKKLGV